MKQKPVTPKKLKGPKVIESIKDQEWGENVTGRDRKISGDANDFRLP